MIYHDRGAKGLRSVLFRIEPTGQPTQLEDLVYSQIAQLRYEIYCQELGFHSKHADNINKRLCDPLDSSAYNAAVLTSDGELLGCARMNFSRSSDLGEYEELYNMNSSLLHPIGTAMCSKMLVRKGLRCSGIDKLLIRMLLDFAVLSEVHHVFIDSRMELVEYYLKMGLKVCGSQFTHHETGEALPLMIDLNQSRHLEAMQFFLGGSPLGLRTPTEASSSQRA